MKSIVVLVLASMPSIIQYLYKWSFTTSIYPAVACLRGCEVPESKGNSGQDMKMKRIKYISVPIKMSLHSHLHSCHLTGHDFQLYRVLNQALACYNKKEPDRKFRMATLSHCQSLKHIFRTAKLLSCSQGLNFKRHGYTLFFSFTESTT